LQTASPQPVTRRSTARCLLLIAGLLHDIGLYDEASHGGVYVLEGAEFTAELLRRQAGMRSESASAPMPLTAITSFAHSGTVAPRSS
jgi:HD superfamily phosphodiesterase